MSTKTAAITYRPARDRFEAYRADVEAAKAAFVRTETVLLQVLTKAQLMATGDVVIHESYSKAELIEDAVDSRWRRRVEAQEYDRLLHLEGREDEVISSIESIQGRLDEALQVVVNIAKDGTDLLGLESAVSLARQIKEHADLWKQVADLIGPDGREPLDAMRVVAKYATERALDALEDRNSDTLPARMAARWVRRNESMINALEYYK